MGVIDPQILALQTLGCTEEDIADVLKCDKEIDRGAKMFELAEELKPGAKKARRADRTDTPKQAVRERKPNEDKQFLLEQLVNAIPTECEIVNPYLEFLFTYNGTKYKVILSAPRK